MSAENQVASGAEQQEELLGYRNSMNGFKVRPKEAALVVVDMQYGSAGRGYGFQAMFESIGHGDVTEAYMKRIDDLLIPSIQKMQEAFRATGSPIVYLTVGTATDDYSDMLPQFKRAVAHFQERGIMVPYAKAGSREIQVRDEIAPRDGEPVLLKKSAGGFATSNIHEVLQGFGATQVVVCGVATNYCVQSTYRGAADRGYDCVIVEDACSDVTQDMHEVGMTSMAPLGRVATAQTVFDELTA